VRKWQEGGCCHPDLCGAVGEVEQRHQRGDEVGLADLQVGRQQVAAPELWSGSGGSGEATEHTDSQ
jgi:hypothetical protein